MPLIPGSLPPDTCYGTPQSLLELFAQYLDAIPSASNTSVQSVAWVEFDVAAAGSNPRTVANNGIKRQYNVASVNRTATGVYAVSFTTSLSSANYTVNANIGLASGTPSGTTQPVISYHTKTASGFSVSLLTGGTGTAADLTNGLVSIVVFGS
jgi:hypothetical protein